jgi:YidC/Oxa1 family membrane protein insertase
MRHAPFFGWIKDLSAADPTNAFNLFGLLPYDPTAVPLIGAFLVIGGWPLIMGLSQWLQMKLAPAPADPAQAAIMNWLPVVVTFSLAKFSVGLVIYWTCNNLLSAVQTLIVMRKNRVP